MNTLTPAAAPRPRRFRVLRGVSVRLSPDPATPDWERFRDWQPGETVTEGDPAHLNLADLLTIGAIEEVLDG